MNVQAVWFDVLQWKNKIHNIFILLPEMEFRKQVMNANILGGLKCMHVTEIAIYYTFALPNPFLNSD
jgi:hypothetical protein